uniref:UPF0182 protein CYB_0372 n=1 Tax=Anthurium amnicola TaxID=1678845 RepID=A0A1D1Y8T8_9ARAE
MSNTIFVFFFLNGLMQEFSSEEQIMPGSPDDMFLKDLNPRLTPCFPKSKSKEYDEMMGYTYGSFGSSTVSSSDICFSSPSGKLSKSSEHCRKHRLARTAQKTCKSEENKWTTAKQMN